MSVLTYPGIAEYTLPQKNILVLGCIDLRLTDNLLHFLDYDNLTNRYDHFSLAGTSLCLCADGKHRALFNEKQLAKYNDFKSWGETFFHHLQIAIALHQIKDVYIVEHTNCGAYEEFLKEGKFENAAAERKAHKAFAQELAQRLNKQPYEEYNEKTKKTEPYKLNVHCFLLDLRGNVELLYTTNKPK